MTGLPPYPHRTRPSTSRPGCSATQIEPITRDYFTLCDKYVSIDWEHNEAQRTTIGTVRRFTFSIEATSVVIGRSDGEGGGGHQALRDLRGPYRASSRQVQLHRMDYGDRPGGEEGIPIEEE